MGATSRSRAVRQRKGHFSLYLKGSGLDIGCGNDLLLPEHGKAAPWDVPQGDAAELAGIPLASLDFVYSSHSLEHMRSVEAALRRWVHVVKPSGYLFLLLPDFCLYEHLKWPSQFNGDHKHSFSLDLTRAKVRRDNHYHVGQDLAPLLSTLGCDMVEASVEDDGYDYNAGFADQTAGDRALAQICAVFRKR